MTHATIRHIRDVTITHLSVAIAAGEIPDSTSPGRRAEPATQITSFFLGALRNQNSGWQNRLTLLRNIVLAVQAADYGQLPGFEFLLHCFDSLGQSVRQVAFLNDVFVQIVEEITDTLFASLRRGAMQLEVAVDQRSRSGAMVFCIATNQ